MSAGRGRRGAVAAAALALAVAAVAVAGRAGGDPVVVVADQRGREVASATLPPSGQFALSYRHSVYRAEVTETFAAGDDGIRLVAVASPSEAVLDYYELEGRRLSDGDWRRLEPATTPRLEALPLAATTLGRRTLVVGERRLPLFEQPQGPTHLVLTIRR